VVVGRGRRVCISRWRGRVVWRRTSGVREVVFEVGVWRWRDARDRWWWRGRREWWASEVVCGDVGMAAGLGERCV